MCMYLSAIARTARTSSQNLQVVVALLVLSLGGRDMRHDIPSLGCGLVRRQAHGPLVSNTLAVSLERDIATRHRSLYFGSVARGDCGVRLKALSLSSPSARSTVPLRRLSSISSLIGSVAGSSTMR